MNDTPQITDAAFCQTDHSQLVSAEPTGSSAARAFAVWVFAQKIIQPADVARGGAGSDTPWGHNKNL